MPTAVRVIIGVAESGDLCRARAPRPLQRGARGARGSFVVVDLADTRAWFNEYLLAFTA
jgi:hypothetical protein